MAKSLCRASLLDGCRVPGFRTRARIKPLDRDRKALVITLARSQKTVCDGCGKVHFSFYDRKTRLARDLSSGDRRVYLEYEPRRVECEGCGVKQERLDFLASNTKFTKRLALSTPGL